MQPIDLTALLITKYSHDLAGPLGGLQNGIEFLSEAGTDAEDASTLLALSCKEASTRLQIFRNAYGTFQHDGSAEPEECRKLTEQFLEHSQINATLSIDGPFTQGQRSIIFQQLLLAHQVMIYGGALSINCSEAEITLKGTAKQLHQDTELFDALNSGDVNGTPNPKLVHALYWHHYKATRNLTFKATLSVDELVLHTAL